MLPSRSEDIAVCEGPAWLASLAALPNGQVLVEGVGVMLTAAGASVEDLTVVSARYRASQAQKGPRITGLRIAGAEAQQSVGPAVQLLLGVDWLSEPTERKIGVRTVTKIRATANPSDKPVWVYVPRGDTLWLVQTRRRRALSNIIAALPSPGGDIEIPEFGIAVTFPPEWTVDVIRERSSGSGAGRKAVAREVVRGAQKNPSREIGPVCDVRVYRSTTVEARALIEGLAWGWVDGTSPPTEVLDDGLVHRAGRADFWGGTVGFEIFARDDDDGIAMLWCLGEDLPSAELVEIATTLRSIAEEARRPHHRAVRDIARATPPSETDERPLVVRVVGPALLAAGRRRCQPSDRPRSRGWCRHR